MARALALLVDRLAILGTLADATDRDTPAAGAVREALRHLASRSRDGAFSAQVIEGQLRLEGVPVDRQLTNDDPLLGGLLRRLLTLRIADVTVREGAASAELFTLARLLAQPRRAGETGPDGSGETGGEADGDDGGGELLRTWSVLVSPVITRIPVATQTPTSVISARLATARTDRDASVAVTALLELSREALRCGDAVTLEGIVRVCMAHLRTVGTGGGRLAVERALRHLLHRGTLDLLAQRLPQVRDRTGLLQLFARGGDAAVDVLVNKLMRAQESPARRAYFDSIVALDIGSPLLFDSLHDPRWFVVRNAASLLGEMGVQQADVAMLPLLTHDDERIRVSVARGLVRLATPAALRALHSAIEDPNAEVRRLSAAAYGLSGNTQGQVRPPAQRLTVAFEKETVEDVALEMLAALGRLGSADAVQRLLRIAQPSLPPASGADVGERQAPRESWIRIAAIEALVKARGRAMVPAIEGLLNDADPEVAATALRLSRS